MLHTRASSSDPATKRTVPLCAAFDCGSLPANEWDLCAPCLQAVHSVSSHQHDRFAIFFFFFTYTFEYNTDYYHIVWMFLLLLLFFTRLIRASVTIIARPTDFSRPNTICATLQSFLYTPLNNRLRDYFSCHTVTIVIVIFSIYLF